MATESFEVSRVLSASPEQIYSAWLDPTEHGRMTRSSVTLDLDGRWTLSDGFARARTLETEPNRRIVQSWRTERFPYDASDSRIEVLLAPEGSSTRLTIRHSNVPEGEADFSREWWEDNYLDPMEHYFRAVASGEPITETFDLQASENDPDLTPPVTVVPKLAALDEPADVRGGASPRNVKPRKKPSVKPSKKPSKKPRTSAAKKRSAAKRKRAPARGAKRPSRSPSRKKTSPKRTAARKSTASKRRPAKSAKRSGARSASKKRGAGKKRR